MGFGRKMKQLRTEAGLSQQDVAEKIGMARATYASLEVGRRDPDLAELRALAQLYEIPLQDLVIIDQDSASTVHEPAAEYRSEADVEVPSRSTDFSRQAGTAKLREVLLYTLGKVGARPNFGESVLYKLLYLIDFDYYEKCGRSITGLAYVWNEYGPAPTRSFLDLVKQMEVDGELEIVSTKHFSNTQKKYLPSVQPDLVELTAKELLYIDATLDHLGDKTAIELLDLAHRHGPDLVSKRDGSMAPKSTPGGSS